MEFINTTPVVANTLTQIVKQTFFIWWLTPLVRSDTEELRFHWDADLRRAALDEICFSTGPQNNSLWEAPSVDRSALLIAVVSTMTDADLHEYLRALEPSRRQSLLAKLEKYIAEAEKNVSVLEAMKEFLETLQEDDSKTQQEREEELAQRTREKADALLKEQERLLQEKRVFDKKNEKRQQRQMAEQELVRKERARRLEEKNKIREEEQKQTEMKRAIALRAGTAKSMQSKEEQRGSRRNDWTSTRVAC
ncbi:hypothetical protein AGDE_14338 [Angomonas deanei]|nr:hypothetical protein AGDE_14338 [Angomonas deanei]|eukprot:EPY21022.1 hypothetical protein AGDE_14338 [Angomonas deanei]